MVRKLARDCLFFLWVVALQGVDYAGMIWQDFKWGRSWQGVAYSSLFLFSCGYLIGEMGLYPVLDDADIVGHPTLVNLAFLGSPNGPRLVAGFPCREESPWSD